MVRFLRKLNLWVVLFTLLAYIAPYISPAQMSFLMFVGVAFPWLLVINIIFVAIWALSRMRYWWFSATVILMGWNHLTSVVGIHFGQKIPQNTDGTSRYSREGVDSMSTFRLMTYNIHSGVKPNSKNIVHDRLELSHFIEQKSPDILCLQEFVLTWGGNYDKLMMDDIPDRKSVV